MPQEPERTAARRRRYQQKILSLGGQTHATRDGSATLALRSMGEVAQMLGCSRQAVHQVERTAFHKIRVRLMDCLREENPALADEMAARMAALST